jgi:hypothetical protein
MDNILIACDPTQPGTAYAGIVDDVFHPEDVANNLVEWRRDGATIKRVNPDTARRMMCAWDRNKSTLFDVDKPPNAQAHLPPEQAEPAEGTLTAPAGKAVRCSDLLGTRWLRT